MKDAYDLLLDNKLKNESFSEEIRRIVSKKKSKKLIDYFGILTNEEGETMLKDLEKSRRIDIELEKKRIK